MMAQTFADYCRLLQTEADAIAHEAEVHSFLDHLHAFNFGRTVGRLEITRDYFWLRVRWLLLGTAVGIAVAAFYLQVSLSERILQFVK